MHVLDDPFGIDEISGGISADAVDAGHLPVAVQGNWEGQPVLLDERGDQVLWFLNIHANDHQALPLVLLIHGFQGWHLVSARAAPRSPEVDQHRASLEVTELDLAPAKGCEGKIRTWFSDLGDATAGGASQEDIDLGSRLQVVEPGFVGILLFLRRYVL